MECWKFFLSPLLHFSHTPILRWYSRRFLQLATDSSTNQLRDIAIGHFPNSLLKNPPDFFSFFFSSPLSVSFEESSAFFSDASRAIAQ